MRKVRALPANSSVADISPDEETAPVSEPRFDGRDATALAGLAFVFIGVWQIYSPAAWIVLGLAALFAAWRV